MTAAVGKGLKVKRKRDYQCEVKIILTRSLRSDRAETDRDTWMCGKALLAVVIDSIGPTMTIGDG